MTTPDVSPDATGSAPVRSSDMVLRPFVVLYGNISEPQSATVQAVSSADAHEIASRNRRWKPIIGISPQNVKGEPPV